MKGAQEGRKLVYGVGAIGCRSPLLLMRPFLHEVRGIRRNSWKGMGKGERRHWCRGNAVRCDCAQTLLCPVAFSCEVDDEACLGALLQRRCLQFPMRMEYRSVPR